MQFHSPPFVHFITDILIVITSVYPQNCVYCLHSYSTLLSICKLFIVVEGMKLSSIHDKVLLAGSEFP